MNAVFRFMQFTTGMTRKHMESKMFCIINTLQDYFRRKPHISGVRRYLIAVSIEFHTK